VIDPRSPRLVSLSWSAYGPTVPSRPRPRTVQEVVMCHRSFVRKVQHALRTNERWHITTSCPVRGLGQDVILGPQAPRRVYMSWSAYGPRITSWPRPRTGQEVVMCHRSFVRKVQHALRTNYRWPLTTFCSLLGLCPDLI